MKILPLLVAWLAALYGIWTDEQTLHKRKLIVSLIASTALVISTVILFVDRSDQQLKELIHDQQVYAMTPVQTIKVTWTFENVPETITRAFVASDQEGRVFWDNFDWTDTPDMLMTKGLRVEHLVQPLINAVASGDTKYPFKGEVVLDHHLGVQKGPTYECAHHLLFPLNISLNEKMTLGTLTSQDEKEAFEQIHDVIPYPAPTYAYSADARRTATGFVLEFQQDRSDRNEAVVTAPSLRGFNIIIADNAGQLTSAAAFFELGSQENGLVNLQLTSTGAPWQEKSEVVLIINGIEEKPLTFDVSYVGRYLHAPRYTDEDLPYAEYSFTAYKCAFSL
ncbi:hypothetical protein ACFL6M_05980 [Candidatus Eisenbacteria bacterium]|uniref:Uncharacterized protein n=1 Tax=Eiseniibacteriota bacterium TaxID=2212470 RepID=A0ABV6YLC2_UNCEI